MASPYRSAAREIRIDWRTEPEATEGVAALEATLIDLGIERDAVAALMLRSHGLAYVDAEPDARVFVGWQIADRVNAALGRQGIDVRLYRATETSERWLLAGPDEVASHRAAGEAMLDRPPPVFSWLGLGRVLVAITPLLAVLVGLAWLGAWIALGVMVAVAVIGQLLVVALTPRDPPERRYWASQIAGGVALLVVVGELIRRSELVCLGALAAVIVASLGYQRWAAPREPDWR